MNLNEIYDEISRRTDTEKTKINVAETKRVISELFKILAGMDAAGSAEIVSKGLSAAKKKLAPA
jgi:hypothetical protein